MGSSHGRRREKGQGHSDTWSMRDRMTTMADDGNHASELRLSAQGAAGLAGNTRCWQGPWGSLVVRD